VLKHEMMDGAMPVMMAVLPDHPWTLRELVEAASG